MTEFDESEESEIKVTDRRMFREDGQLRSDAEPIEEAESEEEVGQAPAEAAPEESAPETGFSHEPIEEPEGVDFTMLLNAMAQPALLYLGEMAAPGTEPEVDLERAQIHIDLLQLLRVKCRGNLSAEEDSLLDRILYQLRMVYVTRSGGAPTP